MNIISQIKSIWKVLSPLKGILIFIVILILSHFFWKFNVLGDESGKEVTFWGLNISMPFIFMADHITSVVENVIAFFQIPYHRYENNLIWFFTGNSVQIIWGCTGIKQSFIFFLILLFSPGPWKHKIWYIPLGLFVSYVFNVFRITIITISMENHPSWFHFLHEYFFKYLYYALIFGIWLIWEEKFNHQKTIKKA